jgi:hypothetical protein
MIFDEVVARVADVVALPGLSISQTLDRLKQCCTNASTEQILAAALAALRDQAEQIADLERENENLGDEIAVLNNEIFDLQDELEAARAKQSENKNNDPSKEGKMTSPVFVATFADGHTTRMSTYCERGKLDLKRGIALAHAAYRSRTRKSPPGIVAARFVTPGTTDIVLQEYDTRALAGAFLDSKME